MTFKEAWDNHMETIHANVPKIDEIMGDAVWEGLKSWAQAGWNWRGKNATDAVWEQCECNAVRRKVAGESNEYKGLCDKCHPFIAAIRKGGARDV